MRGHKFLGAPSLLALLMGRCPRGQESPEVTLRVSGEGQGCRRSWEGPRRRKGDTTQRDPRLSVTWGKKGAFGVKTMNFIRRLRVHMFGKMVEQQEVTMWPEFNFWVSKNQGYPRPCVRERSALLYFRTRSFLPTTLNPVYLGSFRGTIKERTTEFK